MLGGLQSLVISGMMGPQDCPAGFSSPNGLSLSEPNMEDIEYALDAVKVAPVPSEDIDLTFRSSGVGMLDLADFIT